MTTEPQLTKIDLPYVQRFEDRHGKERFYFRYRRKTLGSLPHPSDPKFHAVYQKFHKQVAGEGAPLTQGKDSLGWLIGKYQASPEFKSLAPRTRSDYAKHLAAIGLEHGRRSWRALTYEKVLEKIRDPLADRPRTADLRVAVLSACYGWAINERRLAKMENPCKGVRKLAKKGPGYRAWTINEINTFAKGATEDEFFLFAMAIYTALRAGDLAELNWFQFDGTVFRIALNKSGENVVLRLPVHDALRPLIEARRKETGWVFPAKKKDGAHQRPDSLSKVIGKATARMGLSGCTLHGLRTSLSTILAEGGASEKEIASWTGHQDLSMVEHYVRDAEQARLAVAGLARLPNIQRTVGVKPD